MTKVKTTLFLFLVLTTSCEKEADNVKYPEFVPKMIVTGYITPDAAKCIISLSSNLNNYGDYFAFAPFDSIKVTISDNQRELTMNFDTILFAYVFKTSEFPITEGKKYNLKITGTKGLDITSSSTIPVRRNLDIQIDTSKIISTYMDKDTLRANTWAYSDLYFSDFKNEPNYYALFYEEVQYNSKFFPNPSVRYYFSNSTGSQLYDNPKYFSDKDFDGKRTKISLGGVWLAPNTDSLFIKVWLLNIDKSYYDYMRSVENYSSGENPFIEASPVYSNITGGLGIFTSYIVDSLIFSLK